MGVFGVVFGCRGDGGFNGCCLGVSSGDGGFMLACISGCRGVVGFKVATSLRPVREVFRPAWLGVCVNAKKFAQRAENTPKLVSLGLLGEFCRALNIGGRVCRANFVAHTGTVTRHHR